MVIIVPLFVMVISSWAYWAAAWFWTRTHFAQPVGDCQFAPPVSILKPLRGLDPGLYENLRSFCTQDYPRLELLCGVADARDPVVGIVRRLQQEFPDLRIRLVIARCLGANQKASILHALAREAANEFLVVSDSDMRVAPDYLRRVVAPLSDDTVGLVTCPYRGDSARTLTARLEALYMTASFLPCAVVACRALGMRIAMGATLALRRSDLDRLGGFSVLADYLADDFQLAIRMAAIGRQVHLSTYVVDSVLGATTFSEQWHRELRWARTNRICRPREYPGMILTFSTPLSVVLVLATGMAPAAWEALIVSLFLRWLVAWSVMGYAGAQPTRRWLLWLPLRDMLTACVWCLGGLGRRVVWRGECYRLLPGARMERETVPEPPLPVEAETHEASAEQFP